MSHEIKKAISFLFLLILVFSLVSCGGGSEGKEEENKTAPPTGVWVMRYLGNEKGEYVEEMNLVEDFYGNKVNLIEMMTLDYGEALYYRFGEDGKGVYYATGGREEDVSIDSEKITYADGTVKAYTRQGDRMWYEDEPGFYAVLDNISEDMLKKFISGAYDCVELEKADIGDLVALGTYDTAPGNDRTEPLKWRVIDRDGSKLLLLCDQLIDSFSYNYNPSQEGLEDITWENSSLRAFLNDSGSGFLTMFTEEEQAIMLTTHVDNSSNNAELLKYWGSFHDDGEKKYSDLAKQSVPDMSDTDDRVFLLSFREVEKYFGEATEDNSDDDTGYPFTAMPKNSNWIAYVTKAVQDNGSGYFDRYTFGGAWMTRTLSTAHPGNGRLVVYISGDGQVFNYFTYTPMFIRPAVWVQVLQNQS